MVSAGPRPSCGPKATASHLNSSPKPPLCVANPITSSSVIPSTRSSTSLPSHFKLITHSNSIGALTHHLTHLRTAFSPRLRATLTSNSESSELPHLGHRCGAPAGCAAPDGGGDIDPEDVLEGASERVAVAPQIRADHRCLRSVAPEPLLLPGVAVVVVAEALPKAGLVGVQQLDPPDPFGALPEVQLRHQQPGRAAVLGLQVLAVVAERDPSLAIHEILKR